MSLQPRLQMRSVRKLVVLACAVVSLSSLVPTAIAGQKAVVPAPMAPAYSKSFLVTKSCRSDGYLCTVQSSTFEAIPAGTQIWYVDVTPGNTLVSWATIRAPNGSATGVCDLSKSTTTHVEGRCTFGAGSRWHGSLIVGDAWGTLTGFHLSVAVTGDDSSLCWCPKDVYSWTGSYWFTSN